MKKVHLLLIMVLLVCAGCSHVVPNPNPGNYPYEPDTPAPAAHEGVFESEHGTMTFSGNGKSVIINFDAELAKLTGLSKGEQKGSYVFLSGNLPPNGSFPVRYDIAHEMQLKVGIKSVGIDMGLASEDGKSGQVGVNIVTPDRIPMLFDEGGKFFDVVFQKQYPETGNHG